MSHKKFRLIVVGDEILSGKRQDKHMSKLIELLSERGLSLSHVEYVGDDREAITAVLQRSFATDDVVFSTGGIGSTPDDHTRQCAAAALNVPLSLHPQARELITLRIQAIAEGDPEKANLAHPDNVLRMKMGEFPVGSEIIPNSYNQIPGFRIQGHHFLPGFPVMAAPMMAWVLDHLYADLFHQADFIEKSFIQPQPQSDQPCAGHGQGACVPASAGAESALRMRVSWLLGVRPLLGMAVGLCLVGAPGPGPLGHFVEYLHGSFGVKGR